MQIIPTIDLIKGVVVHARKGRRAAYRPLQTPLCSEPTPHALIAAFLSLYPFDTIYLADLDALMGQGNHREMLGRLQNDYPMLKFWIDQGLPESGTVNWTANHVPVIGSESLGAGHLSRLQAFRDKFILSLDFMGEHLLGAHGLIEDPHELWPEKIIVMSLSRIGGNEGPDFQRLARFRAELPEKTLIAAGGLRGEDDLKRLKDLGIDGVLVASALHSGALGSSVLRNYI